MKTLQDVSDLLCIYYFVLNERPGIMSCAATLSLTLLRQRDLRAVGSEAREVLLLAGDQRQQHDVSRRQEGQRVVRVAALSEGANANC